MKREYHVLNLGAGVQSTALYLMFMRGQIAQPLDCAIFADTGDEPRAVYQHLDWLKSLNGPRILVRSKGRALSDDLLKGENSTGQKFAVIPAYTLRPDGDEGRIRRQCSMEYKVDVIQKAIRRDVLRLKSGRAPKGVIVHQYFGISLDESGRARRIAAAPRAKYLKAHFPLIDMFVTRANCVAYLADKVPHETPRSACVFCPFHTDQEWHRQRTEDPEAWWTSVWIDRALREPGRIVNRNVDQQLFLHRSCKPLDEVELNLAPNPRLAQAAFNFSAECLGVCGI